MTKTQRHAIELFDTHAHLDMLDWSCSDETCVESPNFDRFPAKVKFLDDFTEACDFQMAGIVFPGISLQSSRQSVKFAQNFSLLYAAVGIHPNSCNEAGTHDWSEIIELAMNQYVTAIGETGLDKYRDTVPLEIQMLYFERHLDLAEECGLPILIHSRDCDEEMLAVLGNRTKLSQIFGVIHSFSSKPAVAERYLEMGLHISFSGSLTYMNKKFAALHEAAKIVPDDRLLIETDSPFLSPHPYRGKLDNNIPVMSAYVAKTLAALRGTSLEHVAAVTTDNARRIFRKK